MQTYQEWTSLKEQLLKDIRASGTTEDHIEPFLPFVNDLAQNIQNNHRGIEQYLLSTGIGQSELRAIRSTLLPAPRVSEKYGSLLDI